MIQSLTGEDASAEDGLGEERAAWGEGEGNLTLWGRRGDHAGS